MEILITIPQGVIKDSFITPQALHKLEELGTVLCNPTDNQLTSKKLSEMIKDIDVLITGWGTAKIDEIILANADKLKIIAHTGGTVGNLVDECVYQKGIKVLSGNNIYAKSVAEGCLCYIISSLRQIERYVNIVREGGWREDAFENKGLIGKKVGLVGFGAIAKYLVEMLHLFDTKTMVYSTYLSAEEAQAHGVAIASLDEIFETCDVISLHSSLTPKTQGMIGKELLSKIKQGALLVNTARGELIDEQELINQLKTGRFSAVLDVFTEEPLAYDNPLRTFPNVLPVPHMGGPTIDMRENVVISLSEDIRRFMNGEKMLNEITAAHSNRMTRK